MDALYESFLLLLLVRHYDSPRLPTYGFYGLSPIYREVSVPQAPWAGWLPWSS